ncbi:LacI family DNA-binding transcriptional regulator [Spirosoma montaniterrae]|uniref:LacI family transcriptional regulator n=1 Tax=Spirosoma montaniterrae TaxID=1178516 RepID=A0A1P9WX00_9BACT|nr:LacI family DNA-binding transcriptional regulator [Spirosoma montaniterrae]AQG79848.1 LacI family transcriptional regulator [Spirosoma montaniterrae]
MKPKKISLSDIAKEAGVSIALVSYVLSGKEKEGRVGPEIAQRIRVIARELNYQPNLLAKSLRDGRTYTIGLIIADISNPFFANIAREVEDESRRNGYTVIIGSSDENADKAYDLMNVLINRQVDGFIIVSSENSERIVTHLQTIGMPFVLLDRHFPAFDTDFVVTNNAKASYEAGVHLLENGYRRIGFVAYRSVMFHVKERIRGYQDALRDRGIVAEADWLKEVQFDNMATEIRTAIDELLSGRVPIDAIIFSTYGLAVNGLKYFNERKVRVPDDVGVVSFGQAEVFDLYYCPISFMRQPIDVLGKRAVEVLMERLQQPDNPHRQVTIDAQLIARESSQRKPE